MAIATRVARVTAEYGKQQVCTTTLISHGAQGAVAVFWFCVLSLSSASDRVILRDLTVISDRTATACDEDGLRLDSPLPDGRQCLRWDEIERARVAEDLQPRVTGFLKELGLPLLRLRQRLKTNDYRGLVEPADQLWPRFRERKSETAYLVAQACMWGHLANGTREAALAPYLWSLELLRSQAADPKHLPGERRLRFDSQTGISGELVPLWFDRDAAVAAIEEVRPAITAMSSPRPEATRLYFGVLALVAGDEATASKMLDNWTPDARPLTELRLIALAQREVQLQSRGAGIQALRDALPKLLPENQPLANYWLALATAEMSEPTARQDAALDLLAIAAQPGNSQPEVAAAAVYEAGRLLQGLGDTAGSTSLFREVKERFPTSWQAAQIKNGRVARPMASGVK